MTTKMKKIRWSSNEDEQLRKYYNDPNLDVIEIGRLMKRSPGGVLSRLERIRIIPHKAAARGYKMVKKMLKKEKESLLVSNESQKKTEIHEIHDSLNEDEQHQNIGITKHLLGLLINEYNIIIEHSDNIKYLLSVIENEIEMVEHHIVYMNVILLLHTIEREEYTQIQMTQLDKTSKRLRSNSI
jgi:hypothetical protein